MNSTEMLNWLTAGVMLATLGVMLATLWMAFETRRSSTVTRDMLALESSPYLALKELEVVLFLPASDPSGACGIKLGLLLVNPGRVLVNYEVEWMRVTIAGRTLNEPKFDNMGGVVHPAGQTTFSFPAIPDVPPDAFPANGIIEFSLQFWPTRATKPRSKFCAKLRLGIAAPPSQRIEWRYVEGPTYETLAS